MRLSIFSPPRAPARRSSSRLSLSLVFPLASSSSPPPPPRSNRSRALNHPRDPLASTARELRLLSDYRGVYNVANTALAALRRPLRSEMFPRDRVESGERSRRRRRRRRTSRIPRVRVGSHRRRRRHNFTAGRLSASDYRNHRFPGSARLSQSRALINARARYLTYMHQFRRFLSYNAVTD